MHKVHHSRARNETNTNYGNILSLFDRLFSTMTPSARGTTVVYGLAGMDDPATQSVRGLLALPFRRRRTSALHRAPTHSPWRHTPQGGTIPGAQG